MGSLLLALTLCGGGPYGVRYQGTPEVDGPYATIAEALTAAETEVYMGGDVEGDVVCWVEAVQ